MVNNDSINIAIIGTGKIGTDLLIKSLRSPMLNCVLFAGRNLNSEGMQKAQSLGVNVSDQGIHAFENNDLNIDLVFDATSAEHHRKHAQIFKQLNIKAVDLTPAKVGPFSVPCIDDCMLNHQPNINMVTCGGQASIPMASVLCDVFPQITEIEIASYLSPDSIGQATLDNIDDYYSTTKRALSDRCAQRPVSVSLFVDEQPGRSDMLTRIHVKLPSCDLEALKEPMSRRLSQMQSYVPGYKLLDEPTFQDGILELSVSVTGRGDWVPAYAGNLDIINCAALEVAERYAVKRKAANTQVAKDRAWLSRFKEMVVGA